MATFLLGTQIIDFDAVIEETYSYSSDVSENPVERGVSLVDNQIPRPVAVTIRAVVTNTPTQVPTFATQGAQALPGSTLTFDGTFDRARDVALRLRQAQATAEFGTYIGRQGLLDPVLVARVTAPFSLDAGVELVIELIEVRVGTTVVVPIPAPDQPRAGTRRNRGKQPTQDVPPAQLESILFKASGI